MLGSITYFIRQHCRWIKVTTSVSEWLRIPHVSLGGACQAGALMLGGLIGSSTPVMPMMPAPVAAWAPAASGDSAPSGFDMRPGDVPYILSPDSMSPDFLSPGMLSAGQSTGSGSEAAAMPVASSSGDLCCSDSGVAPSLTPTDLLLPTVVLPSDSIRPPATTTAPVGAPTGGGTFRETSIPEPAPVAVVGLGLLAALGSRRYLSRRRRTAPT